MTLREAIQPRRFQNAETRNPVGKARGFKLPMRHQPAPSTQRPQTDALPSVLLEVIYEGILR